MNTIVLTGRLTRSVRAAEVDGTPVVNFTVAVEVGQKRALADIDGRRTIVIVPVISYIEAVAWGGNGTLNLNR